MNWDKRGANQGILKKGKVENEVSRRNRTNQMESELVDNPSQNNEHT